MARKTVKVTQPMNIDDTVIAFEKLILRNDGVLPAVPQSTIYITLGALVGLNVPTMSSGTSGSTAPPPPGTHKVPEDIAAPMRALYPSLKRNYLDFVAVRSLFASTTNNLQAQLGFADGQSLATNGTARNLINRAIKALLGVFGGSENELETYGVSVTVGTASGPTPTPPAP